LFGLLTLARVTFTTDKPTFASSPPAKTYPAHVCNRDHGAVQSSRGAPLNRLEAKALLEGQPPNARLPEIILVAKQPKNELAPVGVGFNSDLPDADVADQVRSSADRIRERVKKTVEDIIEVGNELLAVKEALEHGQFGPWLKAVKGHEPLRGYGTRTVTSL